MDRLAAALFRQIERLGGRMEAVVPSEVPPALRAAAAAVRFAGTLVIHEFTQISYRGLSFAPFAAPREGRFFETHAVFGMARSEEVTLWAQVTGPADDPLVCVREADEEDDDFEAIEAEGRLFRPLSEVLERASVERPG
ncbi:Hypothetical protein A7982_08532 [Minicystis rosea]|nr:Hypothetical protein A7982_08532 [Minicystis rosea]